jgi:hypothetical protein
MAEISTAIIGVYSHLIVPLHDNTYLYRKIETTSGRIWFLFVAFHVGASES